MAGEILCTGEIFCSRISKQNTPELLRRVAFLSEKELETAYVNLECEFVVARQRLEAAGGNKSEAGAEGMVTLLQAAAIVNRSKRTLEKHKIAMPLPRISDGGGKPDEWVWSELRPWLETYSGHKRRVQWVAGAHPPAR